MALVLRPILGIDDIRHNFELIAAALANISGDQILIGTLPAAALNASYLQLSGGALSGPLAVPEITVSGVPVALRGEAYTRAETDDLLEEKVSRGDVGTIADAGLQRQVSSVSALALVPGGAYVQAEALLVAQKVDALIAAMKAAGVMAP